jgi:hypothetical protein
MARKSKHDLAKAKAAKQKKIAIGGAVLLVAVLVIQGPKMLKMMHPHSAQPVAASATTPVTPVTPADPNSLAAPTLAGSGTDATQTSTTSGDLVSAVPMTVDPGQLKTFEQFASKDPFASKAPTAAPPARAPSKPDQPTTTPAPSSQGAPPPPPAGSSGGSSSPGAAVISLNGELMSVTVDSDFPTAGTVFDRSGAVFHLVSLTGTTAKVAIAGGSYADGAATVSLKVRTPLTLQNTADGSKYTLILEPQGTAVPSGTDASASAPAPTSTTPASAVPPSPAGATG